MFKLKSKLYHYRLFSSSSCSFAEPLTISRTTLYINTYKLINSNYYWLSLIGVLAVHKLGKDQPNIVLTFLSMFLPIHDKVACHLFWHYASILSFNQSAHSSLLTIFIPPSWLIKIHQDICRTYIAYDKKTFNTLTQCF